MFSNFIQPPMQLELNDQQKMIQKMVREFAEKEVGPIAAELDETGEFPTKTLEKMAKLGLLGIFISKTVFLFISHSFRIFSSNIWN